MKPQPLTRSEAQALLDACGNTDTGIRDRALLAVLWRGAMRIAATLRIMPRDIDWDRNIITVHKDKNGDGRAVVLDAHTMDVLRIWAERRRALGLNGHHPFFCSIQKHARGNPIDPSHYRRRIKKLQKKAGIEKRCHLHGLRHTGASELAEEGFDLPTISAQLGHRSVATTAKYIHRIRPDLMDTRLKERNWTWTSSPSCGAPSPTTEGMDTPTTCGPNELSCGAPQRSTLQTSLFGVSTN